MSKKKPTAAERLKALTEGKPLGAQTEPSKKSKPKTKHQGAPYVKKGGNGGARPNSGPKQGPHNLPAMERRRTLKQAWQEFGLEEVEVKQLERGTHKERIVKMKRLRVVQEAIYKNAANGDTAAAKEFNDRVMGKSPQPVVGDEDEAPVLVQNIDSILDKAYGDDTK